MVRDNIGGVIPTHLIELILDRRAEMDRGTDSSKK